MELFSSTASNNVKHLINIFGSIGRIMRAVLILKTDLVQFKWVVLIGFHPFLHLKKKQIVFT